MTGDTWHVIRDTWHVTCDMSHVTCDIWHVMGVNILSEFQLPSSYNFGVKVLWRYFHKGQEGTPCRLASSSCGGLQTRLLGKKRLIIQFWPIFGHFWWSVVTLVILSSTLINFLFNKKNLKKKKKSLKKNQKKKNSQWI